MNAFKPLDNKTLRADVANEIIRAIAEGELKAGDRIVELHIAEQMGISRAPIREALRELEGQGVVVTMDRKGTFVADLSPDDVEELFALRSNLEGLAARIAATKISEDDLAQLTRYAEAMAEAAGKADVSTFVENDLLFHKHVCSLSQRKWLPRMLDGVRTMTRLMMAISKFWMLAENQLDEQAKAHLPIISALAAHDANGAEAAVRKHISDAGEHLVTHLRAKDEQVG